MPNLEGGQWYCFEYMAKMNTPGKADGEARLWVDGRLTTEAEGLALRNASHSQIKWDRWMLGPRYGGKVTITRTRDRPGQTSPASL